MSSLRLPPDLTRSTFARRGHVRSSTLLVVAAWVSACSPSDRDYAGETATLGGASATPTASGLATGTPSLRPPATAVPSVPAVSSAVSSSAATSLTSSVPTQAPSAVGSVTPTPPASSGVVPPVPSAQSSASASASAPGPGTSGFGTPMQGGSGSASDRYKKSDVTRNGDNYFFMANGWGPGFKSQSVSWSGTSFTVVSMEGSQGPQYEPASYPAMFCGKYSDSQSKECGLPADISALKSVRTGWRWSANGNTSEYNAAWDIWVGNNNRLSGYLMVWLREPPGQQPAGMLSESAVTVAGLPGAWDVWQGTVNGLPIINWVRAEGEDLPELEFDVLDVFADASQRGFTLPGSQLLSVAVGFEIWNGPITNLKTDDFYVDVQ